MLSWKHWRIESIVGDYWRNFELFVTRVESIIGSFFTVKVIDYRFRFLQSMQPP